MNAMSKSKNRKGSQAVPVLVSTTVILALSLGAAVAQTAAEAQDAIRRTPEGLTYVIPQTAWSTEAEGTQVPQDIRIMQRIVSTALGEVEAPELPDALKQDAESSDSSGAYAYAYSVRGSDATLWTLARAGNRVYSIPAVCEHLHTGCY